MSLSQRRVIYSIFILFFLTLAATVVLYSAGFRYSFKYRRLQQTGALAVSVRPEPATVWLNDKAYAAKGTIRFTHLVPQEYDVRIGKEGYHEWRQSLLVKPGQAVILNRVELFRSDSEPVLTSIPAGTFATNHVTTTSLTAGLSRFSLLPGNRQFELRRENILTGSTSTLATLPIADYLFIDGASSWLTIYDRLNSLLYLFRLQSRGEQPERLVIPQVADFSWRADKSAILYYNEFELWLMDLPSGRRHLLTRLSTGIQNAIWHPSGRHVIYRSGDDLLVIEATAGETGREYLLGSFPEIKNIALNEEGNILYLLAGHDDAANWFEMLIQ